LADKTERPSLPQKEQRLQMVYLKPPIPRHGFPSGASTVLPQVSFWRGILGLGISEFSFIYQQLRKWLRGHDLNVRPSGYEPDELPGKVLILLYKRYLRKITRYIWR
jgi:hypothetical protein